MRASHILLKVGEPMALPAVEEVVKELKLKNNRTKVTDFMQDALRAFDIKVADEFKDLVPPPKPAPAPAPGSVAAAAELSWPHPHPTHQSGPAPPLTSPPRPARGPAPGVWVRLSSSLSSCARPRSAGAPSSS